MTRVIAYCNMLSRSAVSSCSGLGGDAFSRVTPPPAATCVLVVLSPSLTQCLVGGGQTRHQRRTRVLHTQQS